MPGTEITPSTHGFCWPQIVVSRDMQQNGHTRVRQHLRVHSPSFCVQNKKNFVVPKMGIFRVILLMLTAFIVFGTYQSRIKNENWSSLSNCSAGNKETEAFRHYNGQSYQPSSSSLSASQSGKGIPKGTLRLIVKAYIDELLSSTSSFDENEFRNKLLGLRLASLFLIFCISFFFLLFSGKDEVWLRHLICNFLSIFIIILLLSLMSAQWPRLWSSSPGPASLLCWRWATFFWSWPRMFLSTVQTSQTSNFILFFIDCINLFSHQQNNGLVIDVDTVPFGKG